MAEVKIAIEGMHCGACVRRVNQALTATEGVTVLEVKVGEARITVAGDAAAAVEAVNKLGFAARLDA